MEASKREEGERDEVEGGGGVSEGWGRDGVESEGGGGGECDEGMGDEGGTAMSTSCEEGWWEEGRAIVEGGFGRGGGEATNGVMGVRVRME
jgi:hypothetical protein